MSRTQLLRLLDRGPRLLSLLGLLGVFGLAGLFNPELGRLSALSFFSYLAFLRFFRRFVDPNDRTDSAPLPLLVPALMIPLVTPWLMTLSPLYGFLGAAGWLALIRRAPALQQRA